MMSALVILICESPWETPLEVVCSAGIFWVYRCAISHNAAILDLVTVEDWGEEILKNLYQSSIQLQSKMAALKTWFI